MQFLACIIAPCSVISGCNGQFPVSCLCLEWNAFKANLNGTSTATRGWGDGVSVAGGGLQRGSPVPRLCLSRQVLLTVRNKEVTLGNLIQVVVVGITHVPPLQRGGGACV